MFTINLQAELSQNLEAKQSAVRQMTARQDFRSQTQVQELERKVGEIEDLVQTLSVVQPPAASPAPCEEFECIICYNIPPEKVYTCTECEGILCEPCKLTHERTHAESGSGGPLSCPQCGAEFVASQNPIQSRRMERLIQRMNERA